MPQKLSSPLLALLFLLATSLACDRLYVGQGPRDKGGIFLVIAVKAAASELDQNITRTIGVIERRCNQLGIYCKLEREEGGDHVRLQVSSEMSPERVKSVLLSAGLEMRAVVTSPHPAPLQSYYTEGEARAAGADKDVLPYDAVEKNSPSEQKRFVVVERTPIVTGEDIRDSRALQDGDNYSVTFSLNPEGAVRLQSWTRTNINRYIAIILNKEARSIAYIRSEISDSGVIEGRFTREQAEDIAHVLVTGNLPAPVEIVREGTYKP